jgi:hypothetical protein
MDERKQSPIFTKTSDFILWLLNHTESFPKNERFRMAKRIEDSAFAFYELLIEATRSTKRKRQVLIQADVELEKLRLYVRMSFTDSSKKCRFVRWLKNKLRVATKTR